LLVHLFFISDNSVIAITIIAHAKYLEINLPTRSDNCISQKIENDISYQPYSILRISSNTGVYIVHNSCPLSSLLHLSLSFPFCISPCLFPLSPQCLSLGLLSPVSLMSLIIFVSCQLCVLPSILFLQSLLLFSPWCLSLFLFPFVSPTVSLHLYCPFSLCLSPSILPLYLYSKKNLSSLCLPCPVFPYCLFLSVSLSMCLPRCPHGVPPFSSPFSPIVCPFLCLPSSLFTALCLALCLYAHV
jgi:hypothetical protein